MSGLRGLLWPTFGRKTVYGVLVYELGGNGTAAEPLQGLVPTITDGDVGSPALTAEQVVELLHRGRREVGEGTHEAVMLELPQDELPAFLGATLVGDKNLNALFYSLFHGCIIFTHVKYRVST